MILHPGTPLAFIPKKIISLVPSQTELLHYLGLEAETVAITKFCIHPKSWYRSKTKVGGTKTLNLQNIKKLQPDLIIANKEENVKGQIDELAKDFNVLVTDVNTLEEAFDMIIDIGLLTGTSVAANKLSEKIKNDFAAFHLPKEKIDSAYLIWNNPYMAAGGGTFINDILTRCGFKNVFANMPRYPQVTTAQLHTANCKLLLLSTEPYPFKQKHINELQEQLPHTKILLVDGEMFSWYGSRMLQMPEYLQQLVNSER